MVLQTQMHCGFVVRFVIFLCLVGFIAAECVPEKCGSMNVSYPFWINDPNCGFPGFQINCTKDNSTGMMAPFLQVAQDSSDLFPRNYKIMDINYTGHLIINSTDLRTTSCNNSILKPQYFHLPTPGPFTISMFNKFVVIGCNTFGTYRYRDLGEAKCITFCYPPKPQLDPPYCRYGCCEISLPDNFNWINHAAGGTFGLWNSTTRRFDTKCSFSTLLDPSTFTVVDNKTSLFWGDGMKAYYGLRLNWGISLQKCSTAKQTSNYSCSYNAKCIDSPSGQGHVCICPPGYQGNGYSRGTGCTDVDECSNSSLNVCVERSKGGICHNLTGSYTCSCAKGYIGDGFKTGNGTGCDSTNSHNSIIAAVIGSVSSFVGVSVGACGLIWWLRRRRWKNLRIWSENEIASKVGKSFKKFLERELQTATKDRILVEGSFGTLYEGTLAGKRVVIKESKSISEVLINEIIILSHISHRNVVKLLGFCMKLNSPLLWLVYEFVPNGTLFHNLQSQENQLPWEIRLQIASESADAIVYMHDEAPQSNFHRDINSSNILLDDTFTPKVADFGISPPQPSNETHPNSDNPELKAGYLFAHKSNVYNFGVVLVELLTGKPTKKSLDDFSFASDEDSILKILDCKEEGNRSLPQMMKMAKLAKRCLEKDGMKRPSMREVVEELGWIERDSDVNEDTARESN